MRKLLSHALFVALWAAGSSMGQTILDAGYVASADQLVVEIAYEGTHPDHDFSLAWDACQASSDGRRSIVARLIDNQGSDVARTEYRVRRRFDLAGLDCRPADVTLRLGPVSNRTVFVPARGR